MVLPHSDCVFGEVGAVHAGGAILQFHLFQCNECFNVMGCFIVHFVEDGPISPGCKPGIHLCDSPQELLFASILDWDRLNCICIVDVEEANVDIPLVGHHREVTCIVTGDATCDDVSRHEDVMGVNVGQLLGRIVHVGVDSVGWEDNGRGC
jgi:hypothetical protein